MSVDRRPPAKKLPISTQRMWDMALTDLEHEQARDKVIRGMPDVTLEAIAESDRRIRLRQAILNAVDFMITNRADIEAVVARRSKQS